MVAAVMRSDARVSFHFLHALSALSYDIIKAHTFDLLPCCRRFFKTDSTQELTQMQPGFRSGDVVRLTLPFSQKPSELGVLESQLKAGGVEVRHASAVTAMCCKSMC